MVSVGYGVYFGGGFCGLGCGVYDDGFGVEGWWYIMWVVGLVWFLFYFGGVVWCGVVDVWGFYALSCGWSLLFSLCRLNGGGGCFLR